METIERKPTKIENQIYVYIDKHRYVHLKNCYFFRNSVTTAVGHPNRHEKFSNDLYFIFNVDDLFTVDHKKFRDCLFIKNSFVRGIDKKGKMYLKSVESYHAEYVLEPNKENIELLNVK